MSGETNRLLALARQVAPEATTDHVLRELDMIASTGEQVSVGLLALALQAEGIAAVSYTGWQVPIATDVAYTEGDNVHTDVEQVTGGAGNDDIQGQGVEPNGHITTLGRGGSDTPVATAALRADECLIYTDVDGVYTTDPRIVADARRWTTISFEEMPRWRASARRCCRSARSSSPASTEARALSSFTPWDIDIAEEARSAP